MDVALPFALAVLALLATPGPTNPLLAASGALAGVRRSLALVPAEAAGYVAGIGTLTMLVGPAVAASPALAALLKLAAGAYLARSALVLWGAGRTGRAAAEVASPRRVFVTTLLNPKALVLAFGVFPGHDLLAATAGFLVLVALVACAWILAGSRLGAAAGGRAGGAGISRVAAVANGGFAAAILGSALSVL